MQVVGAIKRLRADGGRIASVVSDWRTPGACRRSRRARRLLWVLGFALGLLAMAGVVLSLMRCQEPPVEDEE